jgi:acetyl esterase
LPQPEAVVGVPKAIVFAEYGDPEVLTYVDVELPDPAAGEVRIAVRTAGVNPVECKVRRGEFAENDRLLTPRHLGTDVAGIVDAVGPGVTAVCVGDRVFGRAKGNAYGQYASADVEDLVPKPEKLPWEVAGSLAISAETAVRCLGLLGVTEGGTGRTVLIHGASGSVGAIATQLAVLRGAQVVGTASEAQQEYVRALGAGAIPYGDGWLERARAAAPGGVDAVLDTSGRGVLKGSVELTGDPGRVVTIADRGAADHGVRYSRGLVTRVGMHEIFREVLPLLVDGSLVVRIAARFPLHRAANAHRLCEDGHSAGRIVLVVRSSDGRASTPAETS